MILASGPPHPQAGLAGVCSASLCVSVLLSNCLLASLLTRTFHVLYKLHVHVREIEFFFFFFFVANTHQIMPPVNLKASARACVRSHCDLLSRQMFSHPVHLRVFVKSTNV